MINSNSVPYFYAQSNVDYGMANPSAVSVQNTVLVSFFRRYLLQKVMSVARWTLPETWNKQYFLYALHVIGNVAIINTDKYGVIPQHCTLAGYTVQYQPREVKISNPLLSGPKTLIIDQDCTLFTLESDYGGCLDLVNYYAGMMALVSEAASVNTLNSKLAYLLAADDNATAKAMKKAADKVLSGDPFVVADKRLFDADGKPRISLFLQNLQQNFIAPQLIELMKQIENQFDSDIGLPYSNSQKAERMLTGELDGSQIEAESRISMWMDGWKESCRKTADMFGANVSVDWRREVSGDG